MPTTLWFFLQRAVRPSVFKPEAGPPLLDAPLDPGNPEPMGPPCGNLHSLSFPLGHENLRRVPRICYPLGGHARIDN